MPAAFELKRLIRSHWTAPYESSIHVDIIEYCATELVGPSERILRFIEDNYDTLHRTASVMRRVRGEAI